MKLIEYSPQEVWDLFCANEEEIAETKWILAQNTETDSCICLSASYIGSRFYPEVIVFVNDEEVYSETAVSSFDCEEMVEKIYLSYLADRDILIDSIVDGIYGCDDPDPPFDDISDYETEMIINEREDELHDLTEDFLSDLAGINISQLYGSRAASYMVDGVLDFLCEFLWKTYKMPVYRPAIFEDENGTAYLEDYPYERTA